MSWALGSPSINPETADIIIYRDGDYAVAVETQTRQIIARSKDHATVIQSAINHLDRGKIFIGTGSYSISKTIKGKSYIKLCGAGREVTRLVWIGSSDIMLDFSESSFWGIKDLTINGNNTARYGIRTGGNSVRPRFLDIKRVLIKNVAGTALDLGNGYQQRTDDTTIIDLYIEGNGVTSVGIDGAYTQVKFVGGSISGCTGSAVKIRQGARLEFYGTVFSESGATIIDIATNDYVEDLIFHGCWFEGAEGTKLIKRSVTPTTSKSVFSIVFEDCRIGVETSDFIDLTDIKTKLYIKRGYTTVRTGYIPQIVIDPDSIVIFDNHPDLYRYMWSGSNNVEAYGYSIMRNPNYHIDYFGVPIIPNKVSGSGNITWWRDAVELHTGATSGSYAEVGLYINLNKLDTAPSFDNIRVLRISIKPLTDTYQIIHVVIGAVSDFTSSGNTGKHVGFKIVDNTLYATVADGTTEATLNLGTITAGTVYKLEAVLFPSKEVRFFVNGTDKGSITTNLPSGTEANVFHASISNTEALDKYMQIYEIVVNQW